jgi:NADH-quinone oxidoreductase subunit G
VAPTSEKSGRFVPWEGRRRPFDLTLTNTGLMSDGRVLNALAEELDVNLGLPTTAAARDELLKFQTPPSRPDAPTVSAATPSVPDSGSALLSTWPELLDAGRMQDGDEHLAGTAKPARALLSAATAAEIGVEDGGTLAVSTEHGALVLPVVVDASIADRVVWVPSTARDRAVRPALGVTSGAVVTLTNSSAPPVIAAGGDQ